MDNTNKFIIVLIILTISEHLSTAATCPDGFVGYNNLCAECGITFNKPNVKIVGGVDAVPNSWPSVAMVVQRYKGNHIINGRNVLIEEEYQSMGTLITSFTILTAAFCVTDEFYYNGNTYFMNFINNPFYSSLESTFTIYLGVHNASFLNTTAQSPSPPAASFNVSNVIVHPSYDSFNELNNLALLILQTEVNFTTAIQPACLPSYSTTYPSANTVSYAAGWGALSYGGTYPVILNNVNLTIYSMIKCSNVLISLIKDPYSQICAGDTQGGKDTCERDGGGGLYVLDTIGVKQKYIVAGITNYGYGCGFVGYPGLYTRVSYFSNWIKNNWKESTTASTVISTILLLTSTYTTINPTTTPRTSTNSPIQLTNISVVPTSSKENNVTNNYLGLEIGLPFALLVAAALIGLVVYLIKKYSNNNAVSQSSANNNQTSINQPNPDNNTPNNVTINNFFIQPPNIEPLPLNPHSFLSKTSQIEEKAKKLMHLNNYLQKKESSNPEPSLNEEKSSLDFLSKMQPIPPEPATYGNTNSKQKGIDKNQNEHEIKISEVNEEENA